jgi:peptidyl-tRNA hydrolase
MTESPRTLITARSAFHDALRSAWADVAEQGCLEMWWIDTDFADWPLDEPAVLEALTRWAKSHRRLTLIAQNFDELARRHPRFVEWRRRWSHVVHCRTNTELEAGQMPTLLLAPGVVLVRLSDAVHWRGVRSSDPADLILARETVEAVLQRSVEAFPATTLGL